jgi:hypothetical protein
VRPDNSQGAAAMQQVADWLRKLGMSEYAQRFAEPEAKGQHSRLSPPFHHPHSVFQQAFRRR